MSEETNQAETQESTFDMGNVFKNRRLIVKEDNKVDAPLPKKSLAENDDEDEDAEPKEPVSEKKAPVEDKEEKKAEEKSIDYKAELEKLQKSSKDTQKAFHEDRKKLSAYRQAVEKLKESGTLLEEEAQTLLDHTQFDEDIASADTGEKPLIHKWAEIWDKELPYLKKYAPDPDEINNQIIAFQHFMQTASAKEIDDMVKDLSAYEDNEVEFTKQMLEFGRQYYVDTYSDIAKAGSIRNLKAQHAEEISKYKKDIDKLQSKYDKLKEKYEDYNTEPPARLSSGGGNVNLQKETTSDPDVIFKNRFRYGNSR